jgi:hypothetical protein
VNDAGCTNNTLFDGRFLDNAQGGLSEAAPNLVTCASQSSASPDN